MTCSWSPGPLAVSVYGRLRKARQARGWTLAQLRAALTALADVDPTVPRISLSYLGEIERGSKSPRLEILLSIALALDVDPAALCRPSRADENHSEQSPDNGTTQSNSTRPHTEA
jgi:transcriptional regulator with XRE-family HTH domain